MSALDTGRFARAAAPSLPRPGRRAFTLALGVALAVAIAVVAPGVALATLLIGGPLILLALVTSAGSDPDADEATDALRVALGLPRPLR